MSKQLTTKILLLFTVFILVLLTGCGKKDASETSSAPSSLSSLSSSASQSTSDVSGSAPASGDTSGTAPASVPAPQPIMMSGTFLHVDSIRYTMERSPKIEFKDDGSFIMMLNTGEVLAQLTGTYERIGTNITLTIKERETTDYLGSDIETLPFSVLEETHLLYSGPPVGMIRQDDQFTKDGLPPMEITPPAPPADTSQVASAVSGAASGTTPPQPASAPTSAPASA